MSVPKTDALPLGDAPTAGVFSEAIPWPQEAIRRECRLLRYADAAGSTGHGSGRRHHSGGRGGGHDVRGRGGAAWAAGAADRPRQGGGRKDSHLGRGAVQLHQSGNRARAVPVAQSPLCPVGAQTLYPMGFHCARRCGRNRLARKDAGAAVLRRVRHRDHRHAAPRHGAGRGHPVAGLRARRGPARGGGICRGNLTRAGAGGVGGRGDRGQVDSQDGGQPLWLPAGRRVRPARDRNAARTGAADLRRTGAGADEGAGGRGGGGPRGRRACQL